MKPEPAPTATTVTLKDGRKLAYAEYGDPNGKPVLEFHGWPGCRLEARNYDEAGKKVGARVIGIDRPGFGQSTYKRKYKINDWPNDVIEFAEALGLGKFGVVGISSGSPYSLVCGRFIPERLTACTVVSGVAPLKEPGEKIRPQDFLEPQEIQIARLANILPFVARFAFGYVLGQFRKDPEKALEGFAKDLPPADLELIKDEQAKREFQETVLECARNGTRGPVESVGLEVKWWGFRLQDIAMHVNLWQGELDNLTTPAGAKYMAERLPDCTLHMVPDAGHLATVALQAEDVLAEIVAAS